MYRRKNISSCWFPNRHCSEPLIHALETRAESFRGTRFASEKVLFSLVHHRNGTPFQNSANVTRTTTTGENTIHGYVRGLISNSISRNLAWKINRFSPFVLDRKICVDLQFALIPYISNPSEKALRNTGCRYQSVIN